MNALGIDLEDVSRFELDRLNDGEFLSKIFTQRELDYCYSKAHPAEHLAARYCAKEATLKALGNAGEPGPLAMNLIEIHHELSGRTWVEIHESYIASKKYRFSVSMAHTATQATAIVLIF